MKHFAIDMHQRPFRAPRTVRHRLAMHSDPFARPFIAPLGEYEPYPGLVCMEWENYKHFSEGEIIEVVW